ncbi:hypothetical protein MJO29_013155 [Puccinia striiformis f. sp. tritici]|nr:hypothetical protein MJO29_013155 [Puccinia striiformis f. sp. tritici]
MLVDSSQEQRRRVGSRKTITTADALQVEDFQSEMKAKINSAKNRVHQVAGSTSSPSAGDAKPSDCNISRFESWLRIGATNPSGHEANRLDHIGSFGRTATVSKTDDLGQAERLDDGQERPESSYETHGIRPSEKLQKALTSKNLDHLDLIIGDIEIPETGKIVRRLDWVAILCFSEDGQPFPDPDTDPAPSDLDLDCHGPRDQIIEEDAAPVSVEVFYPWKSASPSTWITIPKDKRQHMNTSYSVDLSACCPTRQASVVDVLISRRISDMSLPSFFASGFLFTHAESSWEVAKAGVHGTRISGRPIYASDMPSHQVASVSPFQ